MPVRKRAFVGIAGLLALVCFERSWAQPSIPLAPPPPGTTHEVSPEDAAKEKARLEAAFAAAMQAKNYTEAERLLRDGLIPLDHDNFVPWYNLACVLSLSGKLDDAANMLDQALARGYLNLAQMESDPDLSALRETPRYQKIVANWSGVVDLHQRGRVDRLKRQYRAGESGSKYTYELDDRKRLAYISAFDARLFGEAKAELDRLEGWWQSEVASEASPPDAVNPKPSPVKPPPIVTVLLPTRDDYRVWAQKRFGDLWERIGGSYSHDERSLVSMDLGSSLRHEFWHVLHWRDMESRNQRHPIWIMEGLCSLPEDVDIGPRGEMVVKPSWRTNIVRRLARGNGLTPWQQMFAMDQKRFIGSRPLAFYAQGRAVFMFLHQKQKLRAWYTAYVHSFAQDATGKEAFEQAFSKPLKDVEKDFRAWCKQLPEIEEEVGRGRANLPVDVDPGTGSGVVVSAMDLGAMLAQGAADQERTGGLKPRDVITSIDSKPIRDFNDLARVLGGYEPGARVDVQFTRRDKSMTTRVVLVPPRS